VLCQGGTPAPIGVMGELCIGGLGLARGYLNRSELTRERFVADPFAPGARLYRTGDAARYLADGQIECIGRLDRQVKLRGFRVEPGEIETVLASHPAVQESAVIVQQGPAGDQLSAYITLRRAATVCRGELIDFLQGRLPAHMIPASIVFLDDLPRTTSGKINRTALSSAIPIRADARQPKTAPRTELEAVVVHLYEQVLGIEDVGVHDHFFRELGGHSLLATRLASRIRAALEVEVPLQMLFEACTPATLAERIERSNSTLPRLALLADHAADHATTA
jgi:acyl carrier protein